MAANLVGVASGVNIYYPEVSDLYEQFNVQNWIKLNNKDDLNFSLISLNHTVDKLYLIAAYL